MITIEQCRGARGILGWTQQELADACGLSKTAINNFEKGHSDIKAESIKAIRMAFESGGIDFIGQTGIQKKSENVSFIRGKNAFYEVLLDMQKTLSTQKKDLLILNPPNYEQRNAPIKLIDECQSLIKKNDISVRKIIHPSIEPYPHNLEVCRVYEGVEPQLMQSCYIYDNKIVFELWEGAMYILVQSQQAADIERQRFEYIWTRSKPYQ